MKCLQQQTPVTMERYQLAKKGETCKNEEWVELSRSLQGDFQKIRNGSK